jgi:hypothetical protein
VERKEGEKEKGLDWQNSDADYSSWKILARSLDNLSTNIACERGPAFFSNGTVY